MAGSDTINHRQPAPAQKSQAPVGQGQAGSGRVATRLHEALDGADIPNELVTIPGGGHGGFSNDEMLRIFSAIDAFLDNHGIGQ